MNQEAKAEWTAALRSGEFPQTKGCLRNDDGYCCLGVATELAVRKGLLGPGIKVINQYAYGVDRMEVSLPFEVMEWLGLYVYSDPEVVVVLDENEGPETVTLSELNDGHGYTFAQIADLIDEQL